MATIHEFTRREKQKAENASSSPQPGHLIQTASNIAQEPISWLWEPFIPLGGFTLIEGEEGLGKTFLICALATALSTGANLPLQNGETDKAAPEPKNVLIYTAEDSLSQQIVPRLRAMNADLSRIYLCDDIFSLDERGFADFEYDIAQKKPDLTILDPLFSYTEGNINTEEITRPIARQIKKIAEKLSTAIVGIRHIGKSKGFGEARAAGMGSIAWRAASRSVLLIGKDPDDERRKALVQTKNNLGPVSEKAIGFEIRRGGDPPFLWTGESKLTAARILSSSKTPEERDEQSDATAFLREALSSGERFASDVKTEANALGFTEQNLRTARNKLGLRLGNGIRKEGFGKRAKVFWSLPSIDVSSASIDVGTKGNQHLCVNCSDKTSSDNDLPIDVSSVGNQHLCAGNKGEPTSMDGPLFGESPKKSNPTKSPVTVAGAEFYSCRACDAQIPISANDCPTCGKSQINF